jgi:glycosyltransferase involved in cell wall biosynthesis
MKNKISIISPCFNSVGYIERAIISVIEQNDINFEHIIIDGGSNDGTIEILKKYGHLKIVSESDNGQSDAMNKGFDLSCGDIVVYLNSDDYFLPGTFEVVRNAFEEYNSDIIVGDLLIQQGDSSKFVKTEWIYDKIIHPKYFGFPYNPVCYFYKRHIQEAVGRFPVNEEFVMDYWFIIRGFKLGVVNKINFTFGCFEVHENCKTYSVKDPSRMLENTIRKFIDAQSFPNKVFYNLVELKLKFCQLIRIN